MLEHSHFQGDGLAPIHSRKITALLYDGWQALWERSQRNRKKLHGLLTTLEVTWYHLPHGLKLAPPPRESVKRYRVRRKWGTGALGLLIYGKCSQLYPVSNHSDKNKEYFLKRREHHITHQISKFQRALASPEPQLCGFQSLGFRSGRYAPFFQNTKSWLSAGVHGYATFIGPLVLEGLEEGQPYVVRCPYLVTCILD